MYVSAEQMADQNPQADADQHKSTDHFCPFSEHLPGPAAQYKAETGDEKGDQTDGEAGDGDIHFEEGKAEAYCKRIYAGGKRQGHEREPAGHVSLTFVFFLRVKRLPEHLAPDEGEEAKGNPMIVVADEIRYGAPGQPADDGHGSLKEPKGKGSAHGAPAGRSGASKASPKRYSEAIGRKTDRDSEEIDQTHSRTPDSTGIISAVDN